MAKENAKIAPWRRLRSEHAGHFRIFDIRQDTRLSPRTGREHKFYVLDSADWTNIIPITPKGEVVLIRQFRHGVEQVTLEIPGGMIDPEDATPAASARREMVEETGYDSSRIVPLDFVHPNPAILNNRCYTFAALDVEFTGAQQLDGSEDIAVELHKLEQIPKLILDCRITHALVVAAFYKYDNCRRLRPESFRH